MHRLIRSTETGAFWNNGTWVNDPGEAEEFPSVRALRTECARRRLRCVEMVVRFGRSAEGEIAVPIDTA
jgi:hypothetical protein